MTDGRHVVISGRVALTLAAAFGVLAGCHKGSTANAGASAPEAASSRVSVVCPPRTGQPKSSADASLTVTFRAEPPIAAGTLVTVRLFEETNQSTHQVDGSQPAAFSLRQGVYLLRVSLKGYKTVEGLANLTAGCEATMTLDLKPSK